MLWLHYFACCFLVFCFWPRKCLFDDFFFMTGCLLLGEKGSICYKDVMFLSCFTCTVKWFQVNDHWCSSMMLDAMVTVLGSAGWMSNYQNLQYTIFHWDIGMMIYCTYFMRNNAQPDVSFLFVAILKRGHFKNRLKTNKQ